MDTHKKCSRCGEIKPRSAYYQRKDRPNQVQPHCRDCDKHRGREARARIRAEIIEHYSSGRNACEICGESRFDVLDIDHIKGGGIKDRSRHKTIHQYYLRIKREKPDGLRVLCRNCNWIEWRKRQKRSLEP